MPTVSLNPPNITVPWSYDEYVTITATVQPQGAAPVAWTGAGWTPTENILVRHVARDVPGLHTVYANVGEGTTPQQAEVIVQAPPVLQLFLDVGNNFQQPGDDDLPQYVPGSNLNGTSGPIKPEGTPLHQVRVIAAFVNDSGQIVPPPVTQVDFSLHDTSAFPGYAMNAGTSTAPDFAFAGQNPVQVSAGFAGNLSWANLQVFDYGGTTLVTATAGGFPADPIRIPFDQNNNGIPAEWRAYGHQGHPAQTAFDCISVNCQWQDDDGTPTGTGPSNYGTVGDGLTTWEEYRGFVVRGKHVRTHPGHKDLFVSSVVERSGLSAVSAMQYARDNLRVNNATMADIGVRVHQVWGQDDTDIPEGEFVEYKIVPGADPFHPEQRRINFNGPDQPSLLSQRAVRILEDSLPMGTVGDWRGGCWEPAGPGGGVP